MNNKSFRIIVSLEGAFYFRTSRFSTVEAARQAMTELFTRFPEAEGFKVEVLEVTKSTGKVLSKAEFTEAADAVMMGDAA